LWARLLRWAPELPSEFTQVARISARVFSSLLGAVAPDGKAEPGGEPVTVFARLLAVIKALASPVEFELLAPRFAPGLPLLVAMKGASAYTAATVVTSSMNTNVDEVSALQGPSAAISAKELLVPAPLSPPVATRYICCEPDGQVYRPVMLKLPSDPLVTVLVRIDVFVELEP
jgi:hypothetical protein